MGEAGARCPALRAVERCRQLTLDALGAAADGDWDEVARVQTLRAACFDAVDLTLLDATAAAVSAHALRELLALDADLAAAAGRERDIRLAALRRARSGVRGSAQYRAQARAHQAGSG